MTSTATDSQVPSQQTSQQEQANRKKLIEIIAVIVAAIAAKDLIDNVQVRQRLQSIGVSAEKLAVSMTKTLTMTARVIHRFARINARVLVNDNLPNRIDQSEIERIVAHEFEFEQRYAEKAAARMIGKVVKAVEKAGDDPVTIRQAYDKAVADMTAYERGIFKLRIKAVQQRIQRRVDEKGLELDSPEGAYWLLDPSKQTHTKDCLVMANKAWSWDVLDLISPSNRHVGCGCRLVSLDLAVASGYPNARLIKKRAPKVAITATNG